MSKRTINGKPLQQVIKELGEVVDVYGTNYQGHAYLPKDIVDERLDEILGLNYSFELTEKPHLIEMGSKKYFICCGIMTIYDDNGDFVAKREAGGGSEIIFPGKGNNDEPKDIANDYKSCISSCKVKCAKEFRLGRYLALEAKKENLLNYNSEERSDKKKKSNPSSNSTENISSVKQTVKMQLNSKFSSYNSCIKADIVNIDTGEMKKLVIFNKDHEKIGKDIISALTTARIGTRFEAEVVENYYQSQNEAQYILQKYVKKLQKVG